MHFRNTEKNVEHIVGLQHRDNEKNRPWSLIFEPTAIPIEDAILLPVSLEKFYDSPKWIKPYVVPQVQDVTFLALYHIHVYQLPGIGTITHFVSNTELNAKPHGPDYCPIASR